MVAVTMPVVCTLRAGVATYKAVDLYRFQQDTKNGDMIVQPKEAEAAGSLAILVPGRKPAGLGTYASRGNCVAGAIDPRQPLPQLCSKSGVTVEEWEELISAIEVKLTEAHSVWGYVPIVKHIHQRASKAQVERVIDEAKQLVVRSAMLEKNGLRGELLVANEETLKEMRVQQEGKEKMRRPPKMAVALLILPRDCEISNEQREELKLVTLDSNALESDSAELPNNERKGDTSSAEPGSTQLVVGKQEVTHELPFTCTGSVAQPQAAAA